MNKKVFLTKSACLQANKIICDLICNHRPKSNSLLSNTKILNAFRSRSFSTEPTFDNPSVSSRVEDIVKIHSASLEPSRSLQEYRAPNVEAELFSDVDTFFRLTIVNQASANKLIRTLASQGKIDECKRAIELLQVLIIL